MSNNDAPAGKTVRDAVVLGGGAAGLSAALMLARSRRRVTVVDAGSPRNAPAAGIHGLLGHDGLDPHELLARGREEVRRYGGEVVDGRATEVSGTVDEFVVRTADGRVLGARRLVVATGLVDGLPDVPGLTERWGRDVVHCPYCHGWEVRDRRIAVLGTGPASVHQTLLFRQLSDDVTLLVGDLALEGTDRSRLAALGVRVVEGEVAALDVRDDRIHGVEMADGELVDAEAVAVATRMTARTDVLAGIGLVPAEHPMGLHLEADATGRTAVPGVWAAGNSADLAAQVGAAAAAGALAGAQVNADLVMADADRAVESAAEEGLSTRLHAAG